MPSNLDYFSAAATSIEAKWWELLCAEWFGRKEVGVDGTSVVTVHYWRGKAYMTDHRLVNP